MAKRRMKRIFCLLLAVVLFASMATTAYACNGAGGLSTIQSILVKYVQNHHNFITKEIVRTQFRTAAAAGAAVGCTTAATMLNHSLQNRPADLNFGSNTLYARQIRASEEFREIVNQLRKDATPGQSYNTGGSTDLDSTLDLYLAYNSVGYTVNGTWNGQAWDVFVTFTDYYDFDKLAWEENLSDSAAVIAINNYAAYAQEMGAIKNYNITITVQTTIPG